MKKLNVNVLYDGIHYWIYNGAVDSILRFSSCGEVRFCDCKCIKATLVRFYEDPGDCEIPLLVFAKNEENKIAIFRLYRFDGDQAMCIFNGLYVSNEGFVYKTIKQLRVKNGSDTDFYFITEDQWGKWKAYRMIKYSLDNALDPFVVLDCVTNDNPDYCINFNDLMSTFVTKGIIDDVNSRHDDHWYEKNHGYNIEDISYSDIDNDDISFGLSPSDMKRMLIRQRLYDKPYTPERITSLEENEVFVFGSNLQGQHGGGAARVAHQQFGAVWGLGVGLAGQSYAIPTMQGGVDTIRPYVDQFIEVAKAMSEKFFYVTPIGCGIAGFKVEQIAPLFRGALELPNVALPEDFINYLKTH